MLTVLGTNWARGGHDHVFVAAVDDGWHHGVVPRDWHLERYPGKYVAIDMRTDEVVLVADTPQELHDEIQRRGLRHVAAMRAPREDEPLFVGPG